MPARSAIIATAADWGQECAALCAAHGVDARVTDDGLDALMAALDSVPEIVVYDAGLPGVDCESLCRKLRQHAELAQTEILLLTESASANAIGACVGLGAHCAATVEDLRETLSRALPRIGGGAAPLGSAPASRPRSEPLAEPPVEPPPQEHRPRILIVDDDRDLLRALKIRLRAYDVELATEAGGRDALYTALDIKPDIVVTDYSMPQGNGEYFLLRLREEPAMQDVPVIVMTGWTFDGSPDRAHERDMLGRCGATVYLRKPIEFSALLAELERHVPMRARAKATA